MAPLSKRQQETIRRNVKRRVDAALANPEDLAVTRRLNGAFVAAITAEGCTQAQYEAALHAYLTDPARKVPVVCRCSGCKGTH